MDKLEFNKLIKQGALEIKAMGLESEIQESGSFENVLTKEAMDKFKELADNEAEEIKQAFKATYGFEQEPFLEHLEESLKNIPNSII